MILKVLDQIPTTIQVAVPKRVKKKIPNITFITLPKEMIFGYQKLDYKGYFIWVAEKEKAYVDILYRFGAADVAYKKIQTKKLHSYAKKMRITL